MKLNQRFNDTKEPWVDKALLSSAFSSYTYYGDELEQLCSIFRGLAKNHAFSDGNKRTAALVLGRELLQIGLQVEPGALAEFTMDVVLHDYDIPAIAQKLRKMVSPVQVGAK